MASLPIAHMDFVLNPNLYITTRDNEVEIHIPHYAKEVKANVGIKKLLNFFSSSKNKEQFLKKFKAEEALFEFLKDSYIILPGSDAEVLSKGLCFEPDSTPFDKVAPVKLKELNYKCALLGMPIEFSTQKDSSTTYGPRIIREALNKKFPVHKEKKQYLIDFEYNQQVRYDNLLACDLGNITHYAQYDTIAEIQIRLRIILSNVVESGAVPIILGGDHAVSFFPIEYLSKYYDQIGVIQFDAHSDLYISPNQFADNLTHANVFSHVSALPNIASILQLGVRTFSGVPAGLKMKQDMKVNHISSFAMMDCNEILVQNVLQKDLPYYISVDLDVLDYSVAPEVNVPVIGGINFYKLMKYYKFLLENYNIVGVDFVETVKGKNGFNYAAESAARLILITMFHFSAATEPLIATAYDYQE
jgi:agmatinase